MNVLFLTFVGLTGLVSHWYLAHYRGHITCNFFKYWFICELKHSLATLIAFFGGFGALIATMDLDLDVSLFSKSGLIMAGMAWQYGYMTDHLLNKE